MNKIFVADINAYLSQTGRRALNVGDIAEFMQSDADRLNAEIVTNFGIYELKASPGGRASTIVMHWASDQDLARGRLHEELVRRAEKAEGDLKHALKLLKSLS